MKFKILKITILKLRQSEPKNLQKCNTKNDKQKVFNKSDQTNLKKAEE